MSFTARVRTTGKIFEATHELDENWIRALDAKTLEDGKLYSGFLYDAEPTNEPNKYKFRSRAATTFRSNDLAHLALPVKLQPIRKRA